jgi:hypothetical protein
VQEWMKKSFAETKTKVYCSLYFDALVSQIAT